MSSMNWNKAKKPGANLGPARAKAMANKKKATEPATEKQIALMRSLGIQFPDNIYKFDAMHLISNKLGNK